MWGFVNMLLWSSCAQRTHPASIAAIVQSTELFEDPGSTSLSNDHVRQQAQEWMQKYRS
jgi:hypothetical protein